MRLCPLCLHEKVVASPASREGGKLIFTLEAGSAKFFLRLCICIFMRIYEYNYIWLYELPALSCKQRGRGAHCHPWGRVCKKILDQIYYRRHYDIIMIYYRRHLCLQENVVASPASREGGELIFTLEAGSAKFFSSSIRYFFTISQQLKFHATTDIYHTIYIHDIWY